MRLLPVHERFYTWQGEGVHMGVPAFFIRLYGCPVQCPFCDSAGTWHPKYVPKEIKKMLPSALAHEAKMAGANKVVITGGEPAMFDLGELCDAIHQRGMKVHLETSGAFLVKGFIDWMTVSPKRWKEPLSDTVQCADELKFIIEEPSDIDFYWDLIVKKGFNSSKPVWLHPEWSHSQDNIVLDAISEAVKNADRPFRAGWQLHKLYAVDRKDSRSAANVPLGGDPAKGF